MTRELRISRVAFAEAQAAASWYESHRLGHAQRFREEFDRTLQRIARHPEAYQRLDGRFRRAFLQRFPFSVIYTVTQDSITILGVRSTKANPEATGQALESRSGKE